MTTHQFSPQQRAALEAVGFTTWMLVPDQEHMNYREGGYLFTAIPSPIWGGMILLECSGEATEIATEAEIRAFVARFVPTLEPEQP